jgi:hypothetical protein
VYWTSYDSAGDRLRLWARLCQRLLPGSRLPGGSPLAIVAGLFSFVYTPRLGIVRPPSQVCLCLALHLFASPLSAGFAHIPGEKHRARPAQKTQQRAPLGGRTFSASPPSYVYWPILRQTRVACAEIVLFGGRAPFPAPRSSSMLQVRVGCWAINLFVVSSCHSFAAFFLSSSSLAGEESRWAGDRRVYSTAHAAYWWLRLAWWSLACWAPLLLLCPWMTSAPSMAGRTTATAATAVGGGECVMIG